VHGDDFSIDNDYTCALLKMLKDNTKENRDNLASIVHKNISTYYKKYLQEILDDACIDFLHNIYNEEGYYSEISRDSGEIEWRKI
jgi:tRNA(Phe) wybutosine-synthesizing methylase Tyw3